MRDGETSHSRMDGKLCVFRQPRSRKWRCSTHINGREHRASTKTDRLAEARTSRAMGMIAARASDEIVGGGACSEAFEPESAS